MGLGPVCRVFDESAKVCPMSRSGPCFALLVDAAQKGASGYRCGGGGSLDADGPAATPSARAHPTP